MEDKIEGVVATFIDVSERRQAEEKLRESEQRLRDLVSALPAAIYTTDPQGRITFYNDAAAELAGRQPNLGKDEWSMIWKLYRPDETPMPRDNYPIATALKEDRQIRGVECLVEGPDDTRVPILAYPTPLHDVTGKLVGGVDMLVDITERKRAERRNQLLVDELNHRVKNTLAAVQSIAAQSLKGASDVERRKNL